MTTLTFRLPEEYKEAIENACKREGFPPSLLMRRIVINLFGDVTEGEEDE